MNKSYKSGKTPKVASSTASPRARKAATPPSTSRVRPAAAPVSRPGRSLRGGKGYGR